MSGIKVNGYTADQLGSGLSSALTNPASVAMLSNPDFAASAGSQGLDLNSLTSDQLGTAYKSFTGNGKIDLPSLSTNNQATNWGMDGWGGVGLGVGQLGLGLASYLDSKKTASAQRGLMAQQAKQNDYNYNKTVADNKHIQQIFNPSNK